MAMIGIREALSLAAVTLLPPSLLVGISAIGSHSSEGFWVFVITLKVAVFFAILVGVPVIFLFEWLRLRKFWHYLCVGGLISIMLSAIFIYPGMSHDSDLLGLGSYLAQFCVLFLMSLMVVSIYWFLARPNRKRA